MPAVTKRYPPEVIIRARREYVEGFAAKGIAARAGTSIGTLYKWLAGEVDGMDLPPIERRRPGVRRLRPIRVARRALVNRLWHLAEQQARDIDARLAGHTQQPVECDRDMRLLSMLIKTLKELAAMDDGDSRKRAKPEPTAHDDDDARDIEEFRRDLVRQMDALVARRARGDLGDAAVG